MGKKSRGYMRNICQKLSIEEWARIGPGVTWAVDGLFILLPEGQVVEAEGHMPVKLRGGSRSSGGLGLCRKREEQTKDGSWRILLAKRM